MVPTSGGLGRAGVSKNAEDPYDAPHPPKALMDFMAKIRLGHCGGEHIIKYGHDETQAHRQKYKCKQRHRRYFQLQSEFFRKGRAWPSVFPTKTRINPGPM
jgi:hypothetical protein